MTSLAVRRPAANTTSIREDYVSSPRRNIYSASVNLSVKVLDFVKSPAREPAPAPSRRLGLTRREGEGHVLTDEGLTYLARRDRAAVGSVLDRWSAERTDASGYAGTALRAFASQGAHQRGLAEFVPLLALDASSSRDHELLGLLPTHRSQKPEEVARIVLHHRTEGQPVRLQRPRFVFGSFHHLFAAICRGC